MSSNPPPVPVLDGNDQRSNSGNVGMGKKGWVIVAVIGSVVVVGAGLGIA